MFERITRRLRAIVGIRALLIDIENSRSTIEAQSERLVDASRTIAHQSTIIEEQSARLSHCLQREAEQSQALAEQARLLEHSREIIRHQASNHAQIEHLKVVMAHIERRIFSTDQVSEFSTHFNRNILPNDHAALQKLLMAFWAMNSKPVGYTDLLDSGFRVFSQNDEDGILLRLFSKIGTTNRYVLEIGSNCSGSAIGVPENLSANLIVNHGWHGVIIELDPVECEKMRYFFSRNLATKHFHLTDGDQSGYFSPNILQREVTPDSVDALFEEAQSPAEPDLFIIDIDGGDYAVVERLTLARPRVIVVEFEKRFRDRFRVVQPNRSDFSIQFAQSGTVSLAAWDRLLGDRGYILAGIAISGFNAFFVREDVAEGKLTALSVQDAFDHHPLFSNAPQSLWLEPDETWKHIL
jgi:hypothetical protein